MNDTQINALANERRRDLLRTLSTESPHDLQPRLRGASERAVLLYHVHLPKLEDAELIEWDRENHVISRGRNFDDVEPMSEYLRTAAPAGAD